VMSFFLVRFVGIKTTSTLWGVIMSGGLIVMVATAKDHAFIVKKGQRNFGMKGLRDEIIITDNYDNRIASFMQDEQNHL